MSRILIIDDDRSVCEILASLLESLGHATTYALSLREGLHVLSRDAFDLVFLDVRLPDGNGLMAIPQIKELAASPEVIIITGEGSPEGAQLAVENGAWDYLAKPLTRSQLNLST
ncbi:MAG: response regulator [Candidatus Desulfacyla sp.]